MDCPACGAPDPGTGNFCARCGAALRAAPAAAPEPPPTIVVPPVPDQKQQVANHWHTLLVVSLMLLISLSGPSRQKRTVRQGSRPVLYTSAIITEWIMVGVVWIGIRRRGYTIRALAGRAWRGFDDFLLDIAIAAGTWFAFFLVAAVLAVSMGLMEKLPELRKAIEFMSPKTPGELALFIVLGATAGLCEEIVFRGYLQRQFAALTHSVAIGVLASAIVFGASHLYEGPERMIIIGVFGAILGTTSALRKSLRPAMIAHTFQDVLAGVGQYLTRAIVA